MPGQIRPKPFEGKLTGFIYLATNSSMPGIVRVGRTQTWPHYRIGDLYSSGVPEPFSCKASRFFSDCYIAEENILTALIAAGTPCHNNRFFKIDEKIAKDILDLHYWNQHTHYDPEHYKLETQAAFAKALGEKRGEWPKLIAETLECLSSKERGEELICMLTKALELGSQECAKWLVSKCGVDPEIPLSLAKFELGIDLYRLTAYESAIFLGYEEFETYLASIG